MKSVPPVGHSIDSEPKNAPIEYPFKFHGSGGEYFGIWIVNILLSILTLGVYSAWAKVRTKRYLYGNTELNGHRFDYHANPVAILKGRILVIVVLIVINNLSQFHYSLSIAATLFYLAAMPWIIVRGLRFSANMTSYRNTRFHFVASKGAAFITYTVVFFLAVVSMGILIPFLSRANARFQGNGHFFGGARFSANPPLQLYFRALLPTYILAMIGFAVTFFGYGMFAEWVRQTESTRDLSLTTRAFLPLLPGYLIYAVAYLAYRALSRNIGFNALSLEHDHGFSSTVKAPRYCWIVMTNALLIVVTAGFFSPWAKVRKAHYLAANTGFIAAGPVEDIVSLSTDESGVASGEFLDAEGFDFGF